jgi:hypothetical protein
VDASIAQRQAAILEKVYNAITLSGFIIGILASIYQIIADIFIILDTESGASVLEKCIMIIPPTFMTGCVTVLFGIIRQVRLVERMEKLAKTLTDVNYVISRLEPMIEKALETDTLEELDKVRDEYNGETSSLKQKAKRALDEILQEEDRMVSIVTYRYYRLFNADLTRRYDDILYKMTHREQLGISSQEIVNMVEKFGGQPEETSNIHKAESHADPARLNPQEQCAKFMNCCKKCCPRLS